MTQQEIFTKVQTILADQLSVDIDTIQMTSNIIEDLNADSLDLVELVMTMEQEFDLSIPDEEAERIRTVGDAVAFIRLNL